MNTSSQTQHQSAAPLRVLVTGASGYLGALLIERLLENPPTSVETIVACDLRPGQRLASPRLVEVTRDIREDLTPVLCEHRIDTVIHLAAVVTPPPGMSRDEQRTIDVGGTQLLLEACADTDSVQQVVVTTSGAAYGYHADNPALLVESDPVRGHKDFAYAIHKREVEERLGEFGKSNPDMKLLVFRPGTILGQNTANQITAIFEKPTIVALEESATPFTFVWDEDVCAAIVYGTQHRIAGTYNLAGDGVLTIREIAGLLGKPCVSLPASFVGTTLGLLEEQGATQYGPEQVDFLRYRPVMSTDAYRRTFSGVRCPLSSRDVFKLYLQHNPGVLATGAIASPKQVTDRKALRRKVAVITGAAGGIGRALAVRFLADGFRVALLDRDAVVLERTVRDLRRAGTRAMGVTCDVTDAAQCQRAMGEVIECWGGIDVLVNNAGITHMSLAADTDAETVTRVMDVNFHGAVHCTKAALASIVERKGSVLAVSSVAGFAPLVGRCAYAASKHALHGYFDTLRAELRDTGVHVMVVCPSYTETSIQSRALRPAFRSSAAFEDHQPGRLATPADVANAVAVGVAERRDQLVLSPVGKASWWLSRIAPRLFEWTMRRAHR